jgi:Protein of unknown function (DUF3300)
MLRFKIGNARRGFAVCAAAIAISGMAFALVGALDAPSSPAATTPTPGAASPSGISAAPAPSGARFPTAASPPPGISVTPAQNAAAMPYSPSSITQPAPLMTHPQLAQLVAPIALYPDPLVAQILMASTYPLEVVEAVRWVNVNGNRALKDDALTAALQAQSWDPSVKALVAFPRVLQMMSDQLQWTEELGNVFLAEQDDVMAAVQSLRQEAIAAGNLKQTPQCRCLIHTSGENISILPADPHVVCAPIYTPAVYGPWPYPADPPYYFPVPVGFAFAPGFWIGFGPPVELAAFGPFWGWGWIDWGHRYIAVDPARLALVSGGALWFSGSVWRHDPAHRGGVAYADPATRARFDGARVGALNGAARGGAAWSAAAGSGAVNGGAGRFGAAPHAGIAPLHGDAVSHGAPGVRNGTAFHSGAAAHGGAGFHGGTAFHSASGHGASGFHNGMASHSGAGFRAAPAAHGGAASHGGGPHFAAPHFAMGGAHGGGPGGGPHGGGRPHGDGSSGGHHG